MFISPSGGLVLLLSLMAMALVTAWWHRRPQPDEEAEGDERVNYRIANFDLPPLPRIREHARVPLTQGQQLTILTSLATIPFFFWQHWMYVVLIILVATFTFLYFTLLGFKGLLFWHSMADGVIRVSDAEIAALKPEDLPLVTVLCPMYKEAAVLPGLVERLSQLRYPEDKLQVLLLLETDDDETLAALAKIALPANIEALTMPATTPRTKPKICNLGLRAAKGEFIIVYDAEDLPDLDQVQKFILAFAKSSKDVGCVQAQLRFMNPYQNLLTRFFSAEYAMYFSLIVPGLGKLGLPTPLGGTSSCLRTSMLRFFGGWDPYNVTEDLDLGMFMARSGQRVVTVNSSTDETATWATMRWIGQRSRWIKGHIQTYFVHMRDPLRLYRELGFWGFVGFQLIVGGTPLVLLTNPIFWLLTLAALLTGNANTFVSGLFPGPLFWFGTLSMVLGNFLFGWMFMAGCMNQGLYRNVKWMLLIPIYWALMSIAAWKALWQFVVKPHYWEKTNHAGFNATTAAAATGEAA
jgi:cellulose synthase/poly-beta-1,6-N-acetylglucosamine synthase-like glycosyltransferase